MIPDLLKQFEEIFVFQRMCGRKQLELLQPHKWCQQQHQWHKWCQQELVGIKTAVSLKEFYMEGVQTSKTSLICDPPFPQLTKSICKHVGPFSPWNVILWYSRRIEVYCDVAEKKKFKKTFDMGRLPLPASTLLCYISLLSGLWNIAHGGKPTFQWAITEIIWLGN